MHRAGQSPELATGTKLFCNPACYTTVRKAIASVEKSLRPYHVVVTEEFRPLVMQVVKSFPRSLKVKCKEEAVIARIGQSGKWAPVAMEPVMPEESERVAAQPSQKTGCAKADFVGASLQSGAYDPLMQPFPASPVDPALAFPILYPPFPSFPEVDQEALVHLMQDLEQHQKMFNDALLLSTHARQIFLNLPLLEQTPQGSTDF
jgi:hypothetical protein